MKKILLILIFGLLVFNFSGIVSSAIYPAPFVGEGSIIISGEYFENSINHGSEYIDEKIFAELYAKERRKEIMSEVDLVNSEILNFCNSLNLTDNCSKENVYEVYEGGIISFLFEGKPSHIKFTKVNSSMINFKDGSSKTIYLWGGEKYNLNSVLSINFSGTENKQEYLEIAKISFTLSPQYLCQGFWINETCQEDNSIFTFDGETYIVVNGSLRAYKNVSETENVSINKSQNKTQSPGITGNVVSGSNTPNSFLQRILRFFWDYW